MKHFILMRSLNNLTIVGPNSCTNGVILGGFYFTSTSCSVLFTFLPEVSVLRVSHLSFDPFGRGLCARWEIQVKFHFSLCEHQVVPTSFVEGGSPGSVFFGSIFVNYQMDLIICTHILESSNLFHTVFYYYGSVIWLEILSIYEHEKSLHFIMSFSISLEI